METLQTIIVILSVITLNAAIPIVIGANIGTTSAALIVSMKLSPMAWLAALSASLFNVVGVLLIFPFFSLLGQLARHLTDVPAIQVAIAFTASNTITSVFFLIFLNPTVRLLKKHRWYQQWEKHTRHLN